VPGLVRADNFLVGRRRGYRRRQQRASGTDSAAAAVVAVVDVGDNAGLVQERRRLRRRGVVGAGVRGRRRRCVVEVVGRQSANGGCRRLWRFRGPPRWRCCFGPSLAATAAAPLQVLDGHGYAVESPHRCHCVLTISAHSLGSQAVGFVSGVRYGINDQPETT
jgi:hypothetical protein